MPEIINLSEDVIKTLEFFAQNPLLKHPNLHQRPHQSMNNFSLLNVFGCFVLIKFSCEFFKCEEHLILLLFFAIFDRTNVRERMMNVRERE